MKRVIYILIVTASILFGSCASPVYLPRTDRVGENQYGSYINVQLSKSVFLKGELIAVSPDYVYVLVDKDSVTRVDSMSRTQIKYYTMRYARSKAANYVWVIPASTAVTITHGFYAIFTMPINLLTTIIVCINADASYQVNKKNISWDDLRMFARFPQGIPPGIRAVDIK